MSVDNEERRKRLKRLAAVLAGKGLDPASAVEALPELQTAALSNEPLEGTPQIGEQLVRLRRDAEAPGRLDITDPTQARARMARTARRPLRSPSWDRLFGALQMAELQAQTQGKRFGMDWSGFGNTAVEDYNAPGTEYNPMQGTITETGTPIRQRILDPAARAAMREVAAMQRRRR